MRDEESEANLCQLCFCVPSSVALLPCQHDRICDGCADRCVTCPWCRVEVTGKKEKC